MEICSATEDAAPDSMGNTLSRLAAVQDPLARTRQLLCHHCKPRDAYILYDRASHHVLVWIYGVRERVRRRKHSCGTGWHNECHGRRHYLRLLTFSLSPS